METFFTGFISGCISIIAVGIFIWTIRRGKGDSSESLKGRTDRNNLDIRQGLDRSEAELDTARSINTGLGNINRDAISGIEDTENSISRIIADSIGDSKKEPD